MVALKLSSFEDVKVARECARALAHAAGVSDPGAVAQATGELGNNCVEHGERTPALLWIGCRDGGLSLRFENDCLERPNWCTQKPVAVGEFRSGGYGIQIARALARTINCCWSAGRVTVRAEFD